MFLFLFLALCGHVPRTRSSIVNSNDNIKILYYYLDMLVLSMPFCAAFFFSFFSRSVSLAALWGSIFRDDTIIMQSFCLVTQRSFPLRGRRLKGKGREFRCGTTCDGGLRRGRRSPLFFLAHPWYFSPAQNPLSLPFARARLSHKQ